MAGALTAIVLGAAGTFLLADAGTGLDPSSPSFWTSVGIGGLFVLAFIRGWIVPGYVLDRAEERIKQLSERIDGLTNVFQNDTVPALRKAAETNEKLIDYLTDQQRSRRHEGRSWDD